MDHEQAQRGRRRRPLLLSAIAVLALVAALSWWKQQKGIENPMGSSDPAVLALGREVYDRHCASCHGGQLEGQPNWRSRLPNGRLPAPPHDPSGHTWHHPAEQLFGIVRHGVQAFAPAGYESDMPAYAAVLSDAEIWAVLAYIRSTWPDEIRTKHEAIDRASRSR